MEELSVSVYTLSAIFFIVAFAYSSVGLGGGSSYTALMALFGVSYLAIPTATLILNVIVTSIGSFNFIRKRHLRLRLLLPFFIASVPLSYIGGSLKLSKDIFYWILLISLVVVAIRIYGFKSTSVQLSIGRTGQMIMSLASGAVLGLLSGIVGIGGGIYLVPLIIIFNLGSEKEAAACGSMFIWLNSVAALIARVQFNPVALRSFIPLVVAVILGGAFGSHMGSTRFSPATMQKVLGGIVLIAIVFLLQTILSE